MVEIKNYTKKLKGNIILDHVDLNVEKGTIIWLKGKNGSGKTMLLRAMCGLIMPDEGEAIVNGTRLNAKQRFPKDTGILIENTRFWKNYTAFETLKILAEINRKIGDDDIRTTLERIGLDPYDRKKVGNIFRIGTSVALLNAVYAFINMFLGRIASANGGYIALLSFTTGSKLESLTWYTALGLSAALCAFVAQNYAAGEHKRMASAYKRSLTVAIVVGLVGTIAFVFFGRELFSLFVPDREAYMSGADYLRISGYSQILMMVEITSQGVFYGVGRTLPPAAISVTFNVLRIPLALYLASTSLGVLGIWWAIAATSIVKGLVLLVWTIVILNKKTNGN